ncbi:MAG TPA: ROK family protein [Candidatus Melainabacteria bacterium]|jgi:glucokinase|nr:ROK family protein [Candidatus Melainabacteria bacterium]HIN66935.1 ROK family protein [Candidatus Obscuribacterales bacterium]
MRCIGIDIGGTKIAGGIVTEEGTVLVREECPTPIKEGGDQILAAAIALAASLKTQSSEPIDAVGIGAGGQIDAVQGLVFSATDVIPGWKGIRIAEGFTKELGIPAAVDNDVNVLALGETRFGAARECSNGTVVFLALGTGVGGALLTKGGIHHGAHWSGGEFGHILLSMDANARRDTGGARGTLEAYCSGPGLVETYRELSGGDIPNMTGHDVLKDARQYSEGIGRKAIEKTGEYLGFGLVSLSNALDPDLIIIGGGLSELGDWLLEPARRVLKEYALPGPAGCKVVRAELGLDAAIVGAASLVLRGTAGTVVC